MDLVSKMVSIKGIGASSGIGIGLVHKIEESSYNIKEVSSLSEKEEMMLLSNAIESARMELNALCEKAMHTVGEKEAEIFDAHVLFLEDPEFISSIESFISKGKTASYSVEQTKNMFIAMFDAIDDEYMKERASDIKDVSDRLIKILLDAKESLHFESPVIVVAEDLTPSMTVSLDPKLVLGFITRVGGKTSHSAIMARNMGIPAVVGVGDISQLNDCHVIMNGDTGKIIVDPDNASFETAIKEKEKLDKKRALLKDYIGKETLTKDGHPIELVCNIGSDGDIPLVLSNDGEGVGLFRSEFLYMDQPSMPSEEFQYQAYKKVVEQIHGPVIIRTLDVGGDKDIPYIHLEEEMNPFLGVRAVRLCLKDTELFQTQLRALLRASVHGELKIMFPMVSSYEEIVLIKEQLEISKKQLKEKGLKYDEHIKIGIMIEIPSAALMADVLAKEVDFFSIGTNDLVQYTTATDRINQNVSHLYTHYHPAVLRLIHQVSRAGNKENIMVGMCGEAASDALLLPFLIGSGLKELSVSPSKVLETRSLISKLDFDKCEEYVEKILTLRSATKVKDYLETLDFWD